MLSRRSFLEWMGAALTAANLVRSAVKGPKKLEQVKSWEVKSPSDPPRERMHYDCSASGPITSNGWQELLNAWGRCNLIPVEMNGVIFPAWTLRMESPWMQRSEGGEIKFGFTLGYTPHGWDKFIVKTMSGIGWGHLYDDRGRQILMYSQCDLRPLVDGMTVVGRIPQPPIYGSLDDYLDLNQLSSKNDRPPHISGAIRRCCGCRADVAA